MYHFTRTKYIDESLIFEDTLPILCALLVAIHLNINGLIFIAFNGKELRPNTKFSAKLTRVKEIMITFNILLKICDRSPLQIHVCRAKAQKKLWHPKLTSKVHNNSIFRPPKPGHIDTMLTGWLRYSVKLIVIARVKAVFRPHLQGVVLKLKVSL